MIFSSYNVAGITGNGTKSFEFDGALVSAQLSRADNSQIDYNVQYKLKYPNTNTIEVEYKGALAGITAAQLLIISKI